MAISGPASASRSLGGSVSRSRPRYAMVPLTSALRASRPITARLVMLLPQPDSPTRPMVSPSRTVKLIPSTTAVSP